MNDGMPAAGRTWGGGGGGGGDGGALVWGAVFARQQVAMARGRATVGVPVGARHHRAVGRGGGRRVAVAAAAAAAGGAAGRRLRLALPLARMRQAAWPHQHTAGHTSA